MRASSGISPKPSYVLPQRSSRGTVTHGANVQLMPVARVSIAVMRAACSTKSGRRVQPRPPLCGKITAPGTCFNRRNARGVLHQIRTSRTAQPDVVWKDHGAEHVAVSMHRIDAVEKRN